MTLRVLSHDTFSGSYSSQLLSKIDESSLEDILYDLECNVHNLFGETSKKIHSTISKHVWAALVYKTSGKLDGLLVRKIAEECRWMFDLVRLYHHYDEIPELKFIYEQLKEHFKCSGNPMPGLKFTDE